MRRDESVACAEKTPQPERAGKDDADKAADCIMDAGERRGIPMQALAMTQIDRIRRQQAEHEPFEKNPSWTARDRIRDAFDCDSMSPVLADEKIPLVIGHEKNDPDAGRAGKLGKNVAGHYVARR